MNINTENTIKLLKSMAKSRENTVSVLSDSAITEKITMSYEASCYAWLAIILNNQELFDKYCEIYVKED